MRSRWTNRLDQVADIYVGVQTSKDQVYIFKSGSVTDDYAILNWNGKKYYIEKAILRPFLLDVQINPYEAPEANSFIIFPYRIEKNKVFLIQPEELQRDFPETLRYLTDRKEDLLDRKISGGKIKDRQWYQYGRSQSLVKFYGPKIILPVLSLDARYSYDDENIVVTGGGNGPYYLISSKDAENSTLKYLLGALHHPLNEGILRSNPNTFRGGYYSHGKQYIAPLIIPDLSSSQKTVIVEMVDKILFIDKELKTSRLPHERVSLSRTRELIVERIKSKMTEFFELTEEEMNILESIENG